MVLPHGYDPFRHVCGSQQSHALSLVPPRPRILEVFEISEERYNAERLERHYTFAIDEKPNTISEFEKVNHL